MKIEFKNNLFVPYAVPLKFGLSAKIITLPDFNPETINEEEPIILSSIFFLETYPSICGILE